MTEKGEEKIIRTKNLTYVFTCPSKCSFFITRNSGAVSVAEMYVEEPNLLSASNQTWSTLWFGKVMGKAGSHMCNIRGVAAFPHPTSISRVHENKRSTLPKDFTCSPLTHMARPHCSQSRCYAIFKSPMRRKLTK